MRLGDRAAARVGQAGLSPRAWALGGPGAPNERTWEVHRRARGINEKAEREVKRKKEKRNKSILSHDLPTPKSDDWGRGARTQ